MATSFLKHCLWRLCETFGCDTQDTDTITPARGVNPLDDGMGRYLGSRSLELVTPAGGTTKTRRGACRPAALGGTDRRRYDEPAWASRLQGGGPRRQDVLRNRRGARPRSALRQGLQYPAAPRARRRSARERWTPSPLLVRRRPHGEGGVRAAAREGRLRAVPRGPAADA